jgi:hypothetical protein
LAAVDLNSLSDHVASLAVANAILCLIAPAKRYG